MFGREHALQNNKSGAGTDDVYVPKWKYYQALTFLRDTCSTDMSLDNLSPLVTETETEVSPSASFQTLDNVTPQTSASVIDPGTPSCTKRQKVDKKTQQDKAAEAMDYAMDILKQKASSRHAGFLHYLENILEELTDDKAKKLKRQIIQVAHTVQDEE